MTIAGCAGPQDPAIPSEKKPTVAISKNCESLGKEQKLPPIKEGDDMKAVALQRGVIVDNANASIRATVGCQVRQRKGFAGTK